MLGLSARSVFSAAAVGSVIDASRLRDIVFYLIHFWCFYVLKYRWLFFNKCFDFTRAGIFLQRYKIKAR
jgi:hypothetical protein